MKPRPWRAPLALALSAFALAGCFKVDPPPLWFCSTVEPRCPAGLVCDGQRCVDRLVPDSGGVDARRDFGVKPDLPRKPDLWAKPDLPSKPDVPYVPCSTIDDWTCDWGSDWAELTCSNRLLVCTHDQFGWYCDCGIGKDVKPCWDIPPPFDLCETAANAFQKGCCRP